MLKFLSFLFPTSCLVNLILVNKMWLPHLIPNETIFVVTAVIALFMTFGFIMGLCSMIIVQKLQSQVETATSN